MPGRFEVPIAVPALGALVCLSLIVVRVAQGNWRAPMVAAALIGGILLLYVLAGRGRAARIARFVEEEGGS